jgi:hypothetical protein
MPGGGIVAPFLCDKLIGAKNPAFVPVADARQVRVRLLRRSPRDTAR